MINPETAVYPEMEMDSFIISCWFLFIEWLRGGIYIYVTGLNFRRYAILKRIYLVGLESLFLN
jgi:hypothetical protein